ncbi:MULTISPECIES: LacI family DNA-binding transcriptional regulator [Corynebacterium]|uniref:LacI family DNA-binding transcriptional regulator n=1 Tax=Corynebacterium TaxID=1716 RepID=UPI001CEF69FA|nr:MULTISPECIES: LacI family DNA-binding transcriptional regulator [Corynebacterium]
MQDVAQLAGVSTQTVSRVVNNHSSVRPATRERVYAAMRELDYRPNAAAQMLASGSSRSIGVLSVGTMSHGLITLFAELQAHAKHRGWHVLTSSSANADFAEAQSALDYLRSRQVLATVILFQHRSLLPLFEHWTGAPGVMISSVDHGIEGMSTIGIDQVSGLHSALDHLWDQGVTDTAMITGDREYIDARERMVIYQRYSRLKKHSFSLFGGKGWGACDGYAAAQEILNVGLPEAVIGGNDKIAVGCARAFAEHGFTAGKDYKLIGIDDDEVSSYLTPPLSSIRQDFAELAGVVIDELAGLIDGKPHRKLLLPSHFIPRASSLPEDAPELG